MSSLMDVHARVAQAGAGRGANVFRHSVFSGSPCTANVVCVGGRSVPKTCTYKIVLELSAFLTTNQGYPPSSRLRMALPSISFWDYVLLLGSVGLLYQLYVQVARKRPRLPHPPGPRGLPLIGTLPGKGPSWVTYRDWSQTYSMLCSIASWPIAEDSHRLRYFACQHAWQQHHHFEYFGSIPRHPRAEIKHLL